MASLFGGLFHHSGNAGNDELFASNSKYKAQHAVTAPQPLPAEGSKRKGDAEATPLQPGKKEAKRAKKASTFAPTAAADVGSKAPQARPPEAGAAPAGKAAAKAQASKVAAAAAAAVAAAAETQEPRTSKPRLKLKGKKSKGAGELAQQQEQGAAAGQQTAAVQHPAVADARQRADDGEQQRQPGRKKDNAKKKEKRQVEAQQLPAALAAAAAAAAGGESDGEAASEGEDAPAAASQQLEQAAAVSAAEREAAARDKLQRTVFVGNLAATVRKKALAKLFSRYGKVESVRVRSLPIKADANLPRKAAALSGAIDAGRASAHAYVVFAVAAGAEAALAHNMQEFEGLHLRVDRAAQDSRGGREAAGVLYDPTRSLFVGNLHLDIEDEDLVRTFMDPSLAAVDPAGGVEAVRVVRDPRTSQGKGIAFVLFRTPQACKAGLLLDGKVVRGRAMRVTRPRRDAQQQGASGGGRKGEPGGAKAWQGTVVKGRKGKVATGWAAPGKKGDKKGGAERGAVGPLGVRKGAKGGKQKATGKRPSVAARKQRQKGKGPKGKAN